MTPSVDAAPAGGKTRPNRNQDLQRAECVFTAMLESVTPDPVARSYPPIYTHRLKLTPKEVLRGRIEPGKTIEFQFCLGQLSVVRSFYYMSRHHDPIRKQAVSRP